MGRLKRHPKPGAPALPHAGSRNRICKPLRHRIRGDAGTAQSAENSGLRGQLPLKSERIRTKSAAPSGAAFLCRLYIVSSKGGFLPPFDPPFVFRAAPARTAALSGLRVRKGIA